MKKKYLTPTSTTISISATHLLMQSNNEYYNNQGKIRYSSSEVAAEDAD
ncbi:MAG: hypothetical protein IJ901_08505 [Bacteroidaceae bacterium]|nr:hypothetical protein [Bacteroidaceae bacterium]